MTSRRGKAARDVGIAAIRAKNREWVDAAIERIKVALPVNWEGTGEDVRLSVRANTGEPTHPNAWGALMHAAIQQGLFVRTGRGTHTQTPLAHKRFSTLWQRQKPLDVLEMLGSDLDPDLEPEADTVPYVWTAAANAWDDEDEA